MRTQLVNLIQLDASAVFPPVVNGKFYGFSIRPVFDPGLTNGAPAPSSAYKFGAAPVNGVPAVMPVTASWTDIESQTQQFALIFDERPLFFSKPVTQLFLNTSNNWQNPGPAAFASTVPQYVLLTIFESPNEFLSIPSATKTVSWFPLYSFGIAGGANHHLYLPDATGSVSTNFPSNGTQIQNIVNPTNYFGANDACVITTGGAGLISTVVGGFYIFREARRFRIVVEFGDPSLNLQIWTITRQLDVRNAGAARPNWKLNEVVSSSDLGAGGVLERTCTFADEWIQLAFDDPSATGSKIQVQTGLIVMEY